jgi:hypothetical protein
MSNRASDNIHQLINAMTKAEKRYYKVYASRYSGNQTGNYLTLFSAIEKQEVYDEEVLLKKFRNEPFIKRFSITKNRLYQHILKSLDAFHANNSVEARLKRQIHAAEILYRKSLYDQAYKLLRSARKQAEKHERITSLIEISNWEKRILERDQYEGLDKKELKKIRQEDSDLLDQLDMFSALWNVKSRVFRKLYQKGKVRSGQELEKFKKMLDDLATETKGQPTLVQNKFLMNHLYSAYYFSLGDEADSYPYLQENLMLIQEHPHLFAEDPSRLLSTLSNAIYIGHRLGHQEEAFTYLGQLRALPETLESSDENLQLRIFVLSNSIELTLHTSAGNYDDGRKVVQLIEEGLLRYEDKLSSVRKASFYFNIAVFYFESNQLNEALKWINQLLNNIGIDKSQDIHCMGQILNLILHLELGNKSLIPYALRSTQRFLETRKRVYRFETVFLDFINEILKTRRDKSDETLYSELAAELGELRKDAFERQVFEYFDFEEWAKKKALRLAETDG